MILIKNYFTVREAEEITGVKDYTLRYWEEKLKIIKPVRLTSLHRRYTRKDIENIIKIKDLFDKGYSIKGIKNIISSKKKDKNDNQQNQNNSDKTKKLLKEINSEIKNIINELSK